MTNDKSQKQFKRLTTQFDIESICSQYLGLTQHCQAKLVYISLLRNFRPFFSACLRSKVRSDY
jgi:hypothetical protein